MSRQTKYYLNELTFRELEVLALVVEGKHNGEIALELCISVKTVERHLYNIYQKFGVSNRAQAINYALTHGIIELKKMRR